jgi:hydrogenase maturation protease
MGPRGSKWRRRSGGGLDTSVVVIGLGNPILTDDAVGLVALREVRRRLEPEPGSDPAPAVTFVEASVGGLELLDLLVGHRVAVLIDAIVTGRVRPGEVLELEPSFLEDSTHLGTAGLAHQIDLGTAWQLGCRLGLPLPTTIRVLGVEAADVTTFSEELSLPVRASLPGIVESLLRVVAEAVDLDASDRGFEAGASAAVRGGHVCTRSPFSAPSSTP